MNATIPSSAVKQLIDAGAVVIDVMTPEDYAACHVAGAQNASVYEVIFLERAAECVPDRNTELIVYDTTGTGKATEIARDRLLQAGYSRVFILAGGLSAWNNGGFPVEGEVNAVLSERVPEDGTYRIDIENSRLEWIGRNLNNRHTGQLAILEGELVIVAGLPSTGRITVDMHSLANIDLQDAAYRDMLISHLKSDDFFAVDRFPTASLLLTGWEADAAIFQEAPSGIAKGELAIKGISRPVRFPAIAASQPDGSIKIHAAFDIDRTSWGVLYGSCKYFERLGMHLVHDTVSVELFAVARKG
jgi:rhodanese-related sulfurtransferase/polyisoprenoid-binding protein YceI